MVKLFNNIKNCTGIDKPIPFLEWQNTWLIITYKRRSWSRGTKKEESEQKVFDIDSTALV